MSEGAKPKRPRGRPEVAADKAKTIMLSFRVTEREKHAICWAGARSRKYGISAYVRDTIVSSLAEADYKFADEQLAEKK